MNAYLTPENIALGISALGNLFLAIRERNARKTVGALVDVVEVAATTQQDPKRVAQARLAGAALHTVNQVLAQRKSRRGR